MHNEEAREVRSHARYRKSYKEEHAVGEETMFDWYDFSEYIVERYLWSCCKANECICADELADGFSCGCYDDADEGDC